MTITFVKKSLWQITLALFAWVTLFNIDISELSIFDSWDNYIGDSPEISTIIDSMEWSVNVIVQWEDIKDITVNIDNTAEHKSPSQLKNEIYDSEWREVLLKYYTLLNQEKYEAAFELLWSSLISDLERKDERYFFEPRRTKRFIDWIDGEYRIDSYTLLAANSSSSEERIIRRYKYSLSYNINWKSYTEVWNSHVIYRIKEDTWSINTISCETNLCVNLPYFNPSAY